MVDAIDKEIAQITEQFGEGAGKAARDAAKPDSKPKRARTRKGTVPAGLEERIAGFYRNIGAALAFIGQPEDGALIAGAADEIASAWIDVCKVNQSVLKAWEWLTSGGAWTRVIAAHGAIAIPIAMRHGVIGPDFFAQMFKPRQPKETPDAPPDGWRDDDWQERPEHGPAEDGPAGVITASVPPPAVE